jgi:UDP-N-acetylglucosamine acyltransferase
MSATVHRTAIVHPGARLAAAVEIGPYCIVGAGVSIGEGTRLLSHVVIEGDVRIGARNLFYPHSVIGFEPQDAGPQEATGRLTIGDDNVFREFVTVHRATAKEEGVTAIGSHNYLMVGAHVGHDVVLGDHVTLVNNVLLAGHVRVFDHAIISGGVGVHQFTTLGRYSFVAGMARIARDVPPFMLVEGNPSEVRCVNLVGLKRNGFRHEEIRELALAHRLHFREHLGVDAAREELESRGPLLAPTVELFEFLERQSHGSLGRGRQGLRAA